LSIINLMRGQQALYNDIFPSAIPETLGSKSKRNTFTNERDIAMAHRFYYHANLLRSRYDDCLFALHQEFFMTPEAIVQCLGNKQELLRQLVADHATPQELKRKYPYFNWSV